MSAENRSLCDQKVYDDLFEEFAGELYRILYYQYGSETLAEDMVQEAFLTLWNNCESIELSRAKSYLYTVATNKMINQLARQKTALKYQSALIIRLEKEDPAFKLEEQQFMDQLQEALGDLKEDQRVTLMMNKVEGMKHREIAEVLGISQKAVEKRIYSALKILQERLGSKI